MEMPTHGVKVSSKVIVSSDSRDLGEPKLSYLEIKGTKTSFYITNPATGADPKTQLEFSHPPEQRRENTLPRSDHPRQNGDFKIIVPFSPDKFDKDVHPLITKDAGIWQVSLPKTVSVAPAKPRPLRGPSRSP